MAEAFFTPMRQARSIPPGDLAVCLCSAGTGRPEGGHKHGAQKIKAAIVKMDFRANSESNWSSSERPSLYRAPEKLQIVNIG
jgi:hypothetical protein